MSDTPSVTTVVVGDCLPWTDESWAGDEKGPFDAGAIYVSGSREPCSIGKISSLGVMLRAKIDKAPGEAVAVELANGQRRAGTVAWAKGGEVGIRFDEPVDVIALLHRKLVSQAPERRTMPRIEIRCPVHVKCGEHFWSATLRNISASGLQLEGDELPALGAYVSVFVEGLNIPAGEVIWRRGSLAGIEVFEELSWTSIIPWVRTIVRAGAN